MEVKLPQSTRPLTDYLYRKSSARKIPLSGTFELTPMCNFACRMCYVRKTAQEVKAHNRPLLSKEQWLDIAREARDKGMIYLLLTGGEPFVRPDFWEIYEQLSQMGFLISINTNGSLIDSSVIERLKSMPPVRLNITLYGASDETYERLCQVRGVFSKVDRAITELQEAGFSLKLNCSLTPHNAHEIEEIHNYAVRHGLPIDITSYMFPPLRRDPSMIGQNDRFTPHEAAYYHLKRYLLHTGEEKYREYLQGITAGQIPQLGLDESCVDPVDGKIRCRAGSASFWVTWDGWMTPCGMMPEPKEDLHQICFSDAWENIVRASGELKLSGVCGRCPSKNVCHTCAAMAMAESGSVSGIPYYLCHMVQEMQKIAAEQLATGNYAGP